MASHPPSKHEPSAGNPGYERRDVDIRAIAWLVGSVAILLAASLVGLWWLLVAYNRAAERRNESLLPLAEVDQTPPPPRLQAHPTTDYLEFRAQQQAQLNSYGWIDREQGIVRIPLPRARELILTEGLPSPPQQQPAAPDSQAQGNAP
jgi:hypothetical protein